MLQFPWSLLLEQVMLQSRQEAGLEGGLGDYDPVAFAMANPEDAHGDFPVIVEEEPVAA